MQRVYGLVDDELVHRIDEKAGEEKVSRAQWVRKAIESYLHRDGEQETIEAVKLRAEAVKLGEKAVKLRTALEEQARMIAVKDGELTKLHGELVDKNSELDRLKQQISSGDNGIKAQLDEVIAEAKVTEEELKRLKTDAELKWRETSQLRSEVSQAKRELESTRSKIDLLQADLDRKRTEAEQSRSNSEALQKDLTHYQDTIRLKDEHISFLESTVHQALEKLPKALPPSEDEAQKKGWWRFWK